MTRRKINYAEIDEKIADSKKPIYDNDDGYKENLYEVKTNDKGKFEAIIRFLPRPENDGSGVPYIQLFRHSYEDVGGWFIDNCPTTHNNPCPVCKANTVLWKTGLEDNKQISRQRGRRNQYFSNILVVSDPQNRENEGKVFIFKFGKTIFDMYMDKVSPDVDSVEEKVRVYDYDNGLNFKLKISPKPVGKRVYNDYSKSQFVETKTAIADTDEKIDAIDKQLFTLQQIISEDKFKTYDALETRFKTVSGETTIEKEPEVQKQDSKESSENKDVKETISTDEQTPDSFFKSLQENE